jgi:hypothetical protein
MHLVWGTKGKKNKINVKIIKIFSQYRSVFLIMVENSIFLKYLISCQETQYVGKCSSSKNDGLKNYHGFAQLQNERMNMIN